jgi:hypothetical protein
MAATTAMPAEPAVLTSTAVPGEAAMLAEPPMPMRKAVAPASMIPVAMMIPAIGPAVSVVAITNGPVTNGLRHARGQGKPDADQQQHGPRYSTAIHRRLRFL